MEDAAGSAGAYLLALKGKLSKSVASVKGLYSVGAQDPIVDIELLGLEGATFSASLSGKGPLVEVLALVDPIGAPVALGDTLASKGKSAKIKRLILPRTGRYVLWVAGRQGTGVIKGAFKQKAAKGQLLGECLEEPSERGGR